jgi:hypothetical protein
MITLQQKALRAVTPTPPHADLDGTARLELAGLHYQTSILLYAEGRVAFDDVVAACKALAVASRRRRHLRHQAARRQAA